MKLRLFPDSLALRTVLLVVAVIAVAQITTFSLILDNRGIDHKNRTARYVAGQIRMLQTLLPGLDEEARQRLEMAEPDEQWLQLRPDGGQIPPLVPQFGFARELGKDLRHILREQVSLRQDPDPRSGLWIGFNAGGERWWLILPAPRFKPQKLPHDLWWNLAIALTVLLVIAGIFVSSIVRPLRRLGEAVSATGEGSAQKVTPSGPSEVRRLAERHNTMLAQLARAEDERREMLAGLTHDLRAPLARLRVRLALLESDSDRQGLERDTLDMERIVEQCLAFLRSETNPRQPPPPLPIADAVSNEIARQRELGRPVEMAVDAPAAASLVAITHGDLQRLLDNLIDNALQYGAPPVEVALAVERAGTVTLRVRDHGPGIPATERERAFEAFTQIEPARATRGSCGLGLAIVRRIVDVSGGELTLGDAVGGGLEVAIRFPAAKSEDEKNG